MADTATEIITIDAPPERVWDIAVDIANYPNWAHDIKDVTIHQTDDEGRPAEVEFRVRSGAVEVWHWNQRCAVFDRWKLGRWLARPSAPLVDDRAALSVDRMVDRNGRIAVSLPDVLAWTLAPTQLAVLKNLV